MPAFYTDNDQFVCTWIENLVHAHALPPGTVVCQDIHELQPSALTPHTQVHFFCGIGGWPLALALAGWPESIRTWTGSCPCQPFSKIGKGAHAHDHRHLWPTWKALIEVGRPTAVFGEQVAVGAGRPWFARVRLDLEHLGYRVAAAALPAAAAGAPHARERLFFGALADTVCQRLERHAGDGRRRPQPRRDRSQSPGSTSAGGHDHPWTAARAFECTDGRQRLFEPELLPMATRIPTHVGRLRAYGNALVPQVAAVFVQAFMDAAVAGRSCRWL